MHFVAILTDKDDGLPVRLENRPAHIEWLKESGVAIAGPFLDASGDMCGSLLIVEAEDEASARAILAGDPYAKANLFKETVVRPWRWAVGRPA